MLDHDTFKIYPSRYSIPYWSFNKSQATTSASAGDNLGTGSQTQLPTIHHYYRLDSQDASISQEYTLTPDMLADEGVNSQVSRIREISKLTTSNLAERLKLDAAKSKSAFKWKKAQEDSLIKALRNPLADVDDSITMSFADLLTDLEARATSAKPHTESDERFMIELGMISVVLRDAKLNYESQLTKLASGPQAMGRAKVKGYDKDGVFVEERYMDEMTPDTYVG